MKIDDFHPASIIFVIDASASNQANLDNEIKYVVENEKESSFLSNNSDQSNFEQLLNRKYWKLNNATRRLS